MEAEATDHWRPFASMDEAVFAEVVQALKVKDKGPGPVLKEKFQLVGNTVRILAGVRKRKAEADKDIEDQKAVPPYLGMENEMRVMLEHTLPSDFASAPGRGRP